MTNTHKPITSQRLALQGSHGDPSGCRKPISPRPVLVGPLETVAAGGPGSAHRRRESPSSFIITHEKKIASCIPTTVRYWVALQWYVLFCLRSVDQRRSCPDPRLPTVEETNDILYTTVDNDFG